MGDLAETFLLELTPPSDPWDSYVQPEAWKKSVTAVIEKLANTQAGLALLESVQLSNQWIQVQPPPHNRCNAHGAATRRNTPSKRWVTGVISFDPSRYQTGSHCYETKKRANGDRGMRPDEVFFHELIHAHRGSLRLSMKSADGTPLGGGLARYSSEEEFLAIVLTNIYISDETNTSKSGLRRDHIGGQALEAELDDSLNFFQSSPQVLPLLKKFQDDQKFLFHKLSDVNAGFNPLRAMLKHPEKVAKLSKSCLAIRREKKIPLEPRSTGQANEPARPMDAMKYMFRELAKEAIKVLPQSPN